MRSTPNTRSISRNWTAKRLSRRFLHLHSYGLSSPTRRQRWPENLSRSDSSSAEVPRINLSFGFLFCTAVGSILSKDLRKMSRPPTRNSGHPRARSRLLVDGPARAGARSMMRAVGYTDEDFRRPLVGVAHSWIEIMPCNFNHRQLAEWVNEGIREAGGTPVEFNTIAVSDGIAMGTEGMKASPNSREGVAASIGLVTRGHLLDALQCFPGWQH